MSSTVNPHASSWIFPSFVNMADGGAVSKASHILKNLVDEVEGLTHGHMAHGLCAGAANDMLLLNKLCNIIGTIFWGNWDFTGNRILLCYLFGKLLTAQAGKVLAGYENPDQDVAYPDLSVIFDSEESTQLLSNVAISLLSINVLHSKELKPFQKAMLALMPMFYHSLTARYNHLIVETLNDAAKHLAIPVSTLYE
jgi:hypothetical protein